MSVEQRVFNVDGSQNRNMGGGPPRAMPLSRAKDVKGTLIRLSAYLKPYKFHLTAVFLTAVLGTIFSIAGPKLMGMIISKLFEGMMMKLNGPAEAGIDFDYVLQILFILGFLYIMSAFFNYIQQYIMVNVTQKTVFDIRRDITNKLSRLPLKFFDSHTHGEILSRVINDVDNISVTLQQSITQFITGIVTIAGITVMMLTISPWMTLVALVFIPLHVLVTKFTASRSQRYFKEQQKIIGELNSHIEESLTGHKIVKAFGYESESIDKFDQINEKLYHAGWKAQFISGLLMPLIIFISNIGYVMITIIGAVLVTQRVIQVGDILAFLQYSRQIQHPLIQTANTANIIQSTIASAERVFEFLNEPEESPDIEDSILVNNPEGEIVFDQVYFSYRQDSQLIENMNIEVKAGQNIAIVGPTGAGKTTLVNLLMRFYEIDNGKITIDGIDISEMKRGDLRSMFGMVLQDSWFFNGTIRENIAYGLEGASEEDIIQAANSAHADHFIRTLPDGYDTMINEEASNLSQGQKQLLSIARAILADPAILILDEATSSVDTRTEVLIQKAMTHLMTGKTSFIIAHRLSTIRNADLILVMNNGSVIEQGTHVQLLAQDGFYADLYNSQFTETSLLNQVV